jgi:hypothetical protein
MSDIIETLMHANLMSVFNERDESKRGAAIERTYTGDVRWTDAEGVVTGRTALETKCVELQGNIGVLQFEIAGPVHQLAGFGQLAWHLVDPSTGQPVTSGFDTALIKDGQITDLWTILNAAP